MGPERLARRLEYAADVTVDGSFSPLDDSTGAERGESSRQVPWGPTSSKADSARPLMNVAAARASGTANPSIHPSNGPAFTTSVNDANLLNFSSDVLPDEIVQKLRMRCTGWQRIDWNWATTVQGRNGRTCVEARLGKKRSQWEDGLQYACNACEQRMRLCVVAHCYDSVVLLPRKKAEDQGKRPTNARFWIK